MTTHRYTVILDRETDGGFHASCPALPGCHSQGDTLDEAIQNVREAIEVYLESLAPTVSRCRGRTCFSRLLRSRYEQVAGGAGS